MRLGLAYIAAQTVGGVVGAAAAFSSLPGSPRSTSLTYRSDALKSELRHHLLMLAVAMVLPHHLSSSDTSAMYLADKHSNAFCVAAALQTAGYAGINAIPADHTLLQVHLLPHQIAGKGYVSK